MQYVELHARSAFTFLEGASLPEFLAYTCSEQELPGMALLDRDGVYGAPRFHLAAKQYGIKAHLGAELSLTNGTNIPVLIKTRPGYQNLCRLITTAKLRTHKHSISTLDLAEFQNNTNGLVCLTGDERGPLALALQLGGIDAGRQTLRELTATFGKENVYVELQRHYDRQQEFRNQTSITLAREFHLPLLATNGVCYAVAAERQIADVFTCIKNKKRLNDAGRLLCANSQRYIRTSGEMNRLFRDLPEAVANTSQLSMRLEFTLQDLGYEFPIYPVPGGESVGSFLRKRTWEGARRRYQKITDRIKDQIEKELVVIEKLHLEGYFLIVWDLIRFCGQKGILVQGRGSAANSAVCYSLGITAVDPIGMDLLFERFLSEERGEWPDIDLDLPSGDQREKVIQYVYERYGKRGAAMTANVITYRGRSAAQEVGKVLGFDKKTLKRVSAVVGGWEWHDPKDTPNRQFTRAGLDISHPQIALFKDLCQRIQDLPRHLGQHSGGMVICQGQLDSVVPLEPATMPGRVVVQWDKDDCAALGLIKVDLLGLGMMAVLKDSIELISEHYAEEVDLAHLPQNCPDVYDRIRGAHTIGMFQIESCAQMASLPRNNPTRFYDLVTQVALIRPGPITGHMTNPYLKRRQGLQHVTYPHPLLKPVLERTLGIPLFQEQLLKIAMILAGFSGGEAEELRRALGSKRSKQRMREIEVKLRIGMDKNQISAKVQDEVIQYITSFALYGFPESHAASFALIAYASAYLKVRYLAPFTAALLNNWPMGFYHPSTIVQDAKRYGLKFNPIDVTCSNWECTLEMEGARKVVRLGLRYVRGLQQAAGEALVRQRSLVPFISVEDLARRVPELNRDHLAMLAKIGALNELCNDGNRRDALWQVRKAIRQPGPLFEGVFDMDESSPLKRMDIQERLQADYYGTGLTVGPHLMAYRREELKRLNVISALDLKNLRNGLPAVVAGQVIACQRPGTAKGIIFMTLEDETGISRVVIHAELYEKDPMAVIENSFVIVAGVVQNREKVIHLQAENIIPLNVGPIKLPGHYFH